MPINATTVTGSNGHPEMTVRINNGDLAALGTIREKWKFTDDAAFLKFALAVFLNGNGTTITVKTDTGDLTLKPSDDLIRKE